MFTKAYSYRNLLRMKLASRKPHSQVFMNSCCLAKTVPLVLSVGKRSKLGAISTYFYPCPGQPKLELTIGANVGQLISEHI